VFNLFAKTLRDKKFFILGWFCGIAFLGFAMTSFYTSFSGGQIDQLLKSIPPALEGLVGNLQDWRQLPGYLGSQIFDIRLPIFVSILSILLAVSLTVGEEDKGQLRTLVSLPISRAKIILGKWSAIVAICLIVSLGSAAGIVVGLLFIHQTLDVMVLVRLVGFTWLLAITTASLIFAIGIASGRRPLTTTIGILLTIGSFLLTTFAKSVDWLQSYEWLSVFHYFPATDIAKGTIELGNIVVYVVLILVSLLVAFLFFPRRDVQVS
jgi:ABC-2 type transport system permease protein